MGFAVALSALPNHLSSRIHAKPHGAACPRSSSPSPAPPARFCPLTSNSSFSSGSPVGSDRAPLLRLRCTPKTGQDSPPTTEDMQRMQLTDETTGGVEASSVGTPGNANLEAQGSEHDIATLVKLVIFWILAAVIFGITVGVNEGTGKASEYFAGYLLEKSLSVDNLFVFVLIFKYFKVPQLYQGRVLSYGIAGAVVFRAIMIGLGAATLESFEAVNILLALVLIYSSYKLFFSEDGETDLSDNFIVKTCQKFIPITDYYDGDRFFTLENGAWKATPLLLTVAVLELSDVAFAIDSIPAVFGVTRDPFIVFSSNIFAILGLRSLYRLVSESMTELEYLQPSIGIVLGFIGTKMLLDFFGFHISTEVSLGFVATSLGTGLLLSLAKEHDKMSTD